MELGVQSIVDSANEPALAERVEIKAVDALLRTFCGTRIGEAVASVWTGHGIEAEFEIPFVLVPGVLAPPIAGGAPRTGGGDDIAVQGVEGDGRRAGVAQVYFGRQGRPENAEGG